MYINTEELIETASNLALNELLQNNQLRELIEIIDSGNDINKNIFIDFIEEAFIHGVHWIIENNFIDNEFSMLEGSEDSFKIMVGIFGLNVYANTMSRYSKYKNLLFDDILTFKIELLCSNIGMSWCYSHIAQGNPAYWFC